MTQVDAVRRKLVAAVHKPLIDHAVDTGFDRRLIEEVLVLCGGDADVMRGWWTRWQATPAQRLFKQLQSGQGHRDDKFALEEFVAFIKEQQSKPPRKRRSKRR